MTDYTKVTISKDLEKQIIEMQKKIKDLFGIEISKIKASKIVAYKSKVYNFPLNEKKLLQILGGKI